MGCEGVQDRQRCVASSVFRTKNEVMLHLEGGIDTAMHSGKARYIGS